MLVLCNSMHFYEFLCFSLFFYVFLCGSMPLHVFLWISMHFYGFLCFLCVSLYFYALLWFSMYSMLINVFYLHHCGKSKLGVHIIREITKSLRATLNRNNKKSKNITRKACWCQMSLRHRRYITHLLNEWFKSLAKLFPRLA